MGLLQQIMSMLGQHPDQVDPTQVPPDQGGQALQAALGDSRFGGLGGLLQHLAQSGMGGQVASWTNPNAPNQPVDPGQVQQAIGGGELEKIAQRLGVSPESALAFISHHLPGAAAQAKGQPPQ